MTRYLLLLSLTFIFTYSQAQWNLPATSISNSGDENMRPNLTSNANGMAFFNWVDVDAVSFYGSSFLTASDKNGNVSTGFTQYGQEISHVDGDWWKSEMATTKDGSAVVVWYGYTTLGTGTDRRHIMVQKYSSSGVALWNGGNPIQVSTEDTHHMNPAIIADGNNGAIVSFIKTDLNFLPTAEDLYIQRIDQNGNIMWNSGDPVPIANIPSTREGFPSLAVSQDTSEIYISYLQGSSAASVKLQRLDYTTGAFSSGWTINSPVTVSLSTNVFNTTNRHPQVFADASGTMAVFWVEFRSNGEYYMQKVDAGKTQLLPAGGKVLYAHSGDDLTYPYAMQDGENYVVTWVAVSGVSDLVYVDKLDEIGNSVWVTPFTVSNAQVPKVASTGTGDYFLTFKEFIPGNPQELIVMHLDANGVANPSWAGGRTSMGIVGNANGTNPHRDYDIALMENDLLILGWNVNTAANGNTYDIMACTCDSKGDKCVGSMVGVEEIQNEINMNVFPNPANETLTVNTKDELTTYRIFDLSGKLVLSSSNLENLHQINVSNLAAGSYILEVRNVANHATHESIIVN